MIIDERMASFLNSFDTGLPGYLEDLEAKAIKDQVPIVRTDTIALLKLIMTAHCATHLQNLHRLVGCHYEL